MSYVASSDGLVHRRFVTDYDEDEPRYTVCSLLAEVPRETADDHATCLVCVRFEAVYERLPRRNRH